MKRKYSILYFLAFFLFFDCLPITAQQKEELIAINHYISFSNTSTHGMLIVHRLLELYNQEINKYVDLDGYNLNNFSNADLPADIFEDKEHWFYPVSPYTHYENAINDSKKLPETHRNALNNSIRKMRGIIVQLNQARFTVEHILATQDFNTRSGLSEAYTALEKCVELYSNFHNEKESLERQVLIASAELKLNSEKSKRFQTLNNAFTNLLHELRKETTEVNPLSIEALEISLKQIQQDIGQITANDRIKNELSNKLNTLKKDIQSYSTSNEIDPQYHLYGKSYYYHNVVFLRDANHYGSGFIDRWNELHYYAGQNEILAFEEPHYYKVLYPEKSVDISPLSSKVTLLDQFPDSLAERSLIIKQEALQIEAQQVKIQVLDHRIIDGDIISLNFNGKWILQNYLLSSEPKELLLNLNPNESNYLILHAENLGSIHPNTAAIHYFVDGKRTRIVLNSDMNESEMIMINVGEK